MVRPVNGYAGELSPLATLAALTDLLGDCPRHPGPCDCLICAADHAIDLRSGLLFPVMPEADDD